MILRARVVVPVGRPAIADGAVLVRRHRIAAVGRWRDFHAGRRQTTDLGEAALLPGLVNAHCHLDYTDMAGQFPPPKVFTDWLRLMNAAKAACTLAEFAQSWTHGARMLLRTGSTSVGDIEAMPELLPGLWQATPLRVFSFLELIGLGRRPPRAIVQEAAGRIGSLAHARCRAGLSPHAPYTTLPELLRLCASAARRRRWRIASHVAESALEFEMFAHARGEMFTWFQHSGRDMSDCGLGSPVQQVERCGLLAENLLAVHANYLAPRDAALLGERKVSVVHCPRSHAFFRHHPFPLRRLLRAGVNVCLGTDSLATVGRKPGETLELDLFAEMRALAQTEASLPPFQLLQMATGNGARALGLRGQIGEITPHAFADLIVLPFAGNMAGLYDALLGHEGDVSASMIHGRWAIAPPDLPAR